MSEDVLDIIHGINSLLGVFLLGVSDKSKASAATSVTIFHDYL